MGYEIKVIGYREALEIAYNYTNINNFKTYAIISIQEVEEDLMGMAFKAGGKCKMALNIHFSDIDPKDYGEEDFKRYAGELKAITEDDVRKIWDFVDEADRRGDIEVLYVQCHAGVSRSSAVASAIEICHGEDDRKYFVSRIYSPNIYVYERMLRGKGLDEGELKQVVMERTNIHKEFMRKELAEDKDINYGGIKG